MFGNGSAGETYMLLDNNFVFYLFRQNQSEKEKLRHGGGRDIIIHSVLFGITIFPAA